MPTTTTILAALTAPASALLRDASQYSRIAADFEAEGDADNATTYRNLAESARRRWLAMRDPCSAGAWDIQPRETCPVCGALPDTRCGKAAA
jgi:hypothetical protein